MKRSRMFTVCLTLLLLSSLSLLGCPASDEPGESGEAGPSSTIDQSTPKATAHSLADAMSAGDKAAFAQIIDTSTDAGKSALELFSMMADVGQKQKVFLEAAAEKFGQESIDGMDQKSFGPSISDVTSMKELIDAGEVAIDGNKAVIDMGEDQPMPMIQKDGKWYLDAQTMMAGGDVEKMKPVLSAIQGVFDPAIIEQAETFEAFEETLNQRMMGAVMAAMMQMQGGGAQPQPGMPAPPAGPPATE